MIKESLDNYTQNIINHGSKDVIKDPLRSAVKNILDNFEEDYHSLRREYEHENIYIESEVIYIMIIMDCMNYIQCININA